MTPSILSTILILSLPTFFAHNADHTHFEFWGVITCNLNRPFSYAIEVIEEDVAEGTHDVINHSHRHVGVSSPELFKIEADDNGDGPWNYYYEIVFRVHHDCLTEDRKNHVVLRVPVLNFWVFEGTHKHNISFDITGRGDPTYLDWPEEYHVHV